LHGGNRRYHYPFANDKKNLIQRNIPESKIHVITNGSDIPQRMPKPENAPEHYLIYFGALQMWQGIDILLKAFAGLLDYPDLRLVICASNRHQFAKPFQKYAEKLGVAEKIIWNFQLSKDELNAWIQHALFSVAPLKDCSRNTQQGCSPLKIFESMANGIPVIASDLEVVREIITDNVDGKLIRSDRPAELSRAMRFFIDYPEIAANFGREANQTIEKKYLWKNILKDLEGIYLKITKFEKQESE